MRYEKWDFYLNSIQGHPSVAHTNKHSEGFEWIKKYLPIGKVLILGCADGNEIRVFKELGYDPVGITLGQTNIDWAKNNLPGCNIRIMDMHDLEFDPETFDCVFSDNTFEHCFAPMVHLLEVWTVLKPGGKFFISMPLFVDWEEDQQKPGNQLDHHHPNMLPPKMHAEMFRVCGFQVEKLPKGNDWVLTKKPYSVCHETIQLTLRKLTDKNWDK